MSDVDDIAFEATHQHGCAYRQQQMECPWGCGAPDLPKIALRETSDGDLDDVVVEDVSMFRAEFMDDRHLWLCCYLTNGDRITWNVTARRSIDMSVGELPEHGYVDWDVANGVEESK